MRRVLFVAFLMLVLILTGCPAVVTDPTGLVMDGTALVYHEPKNRPVLYGYGSVRGVEVSSLYCKSFREGESQPSPQKEEERNCNVDSDGWVDLDLPPKDNGAYGSRIVLGHLQAPPKRVFICVTVEGRKESACTNTLN